MMMMKMVMMVMTMVIMMMVVLLVMMAGSKTGLNSQKKVHNHHWLRRKGQHRPTLLPEKIQNSKDFLLLATMNEGA